MTKIIVKVRTRAKEEYIEKIGENYFKVAVHEAPEKGLANAAVIRVLSKYFKVSPINIDLKLGATQKEKVFEIKK